VLNEKDKAAKTAAQYYDERIQISIYLLVFFRFDAFKYRCRVTFN